MFWAAEWQLLASLSLKSFAANCLKNASQLKNASHNNLEHMNKWTMGFSFVIQVKFKL